MTINLGGLDVRFRPLDGYWPEQQTPDHERKSNPFRTRWEPGQRGGKVPWGDTIEKLAREFDQLDAIDIVVRMDLRENQIRNDGFPYANASPGHPGVVISFELPDVGRVEYCADTYHNWKANVRAIAKTLENLRACERWGVLNQRQQFRGSKALPPSVEEPFGSALEALTWLCKVGGTRLRNGKGLITDPLEVAVRCIEVDALTKGAVRRAARATHPDTGDQPELWPRYELARLVVEEHQDQLRIEA